MWRNWPRCRFAREVAKVFTHRPFGRGFIARYMALDDDFSGRGGLQIDRLATHNFEWLAEVGTEIAGSSTPEGKPIPHANGMAGSRPWTSANGIGSPQSRHI